MASAVIVGFSRSPAIRQSSTAVPWIVSRRWSSIPRSASGTLSALMCRSTGCA
jgi:hypothetical protein